MKFCRCKCFVKVMGPWTHSGSGWPRSGLRTNQKTLGKLSVKTVGAVDALAVWLIITLLLNDLPFGRSRLVHTWPCRACPSVGGDGLRAFPPHRHCLLSQAPSSAVWASRYPSDGPARARVSLLIPPSTFRDGTWPGPGSLGPGRPRWVEWCILCPEVSARARVVSEESSTGRLGKEGKVHYRGASAEMPVENMFCTLKCYPKQQIRHIL